MTDKLKLSKQVCFPLYTLTKEIIKQYRPILDELDLTYPQYLVMMVLWEEGEQNVTEIGSKLNLDSGTLTPLLKRLEQKKIIVRKRKIEDERIVTITLTELGKNLENKAQCIPDEMVDKLKISTDDLEQLKELIDKINLQIKNN